MSEVVHACRRFRFAFSCVAPHMSAVDMVKVNPLQVYFIAGFSITNIFKFSELLVKFFVRLGWGGVKDPYLFSVSGLVQNVENIFW